MCKIFNYITHIPFIPDTQAIHITFPPVSVLILPVHFAPVYFFPPPYIHHFLLFRSRCGSYLQVSCNHLSYLLAYNPFTGYTDMNIYCYHVLFCSMLHDVIMLYYIGNNYSNLGSGKLIPHFLRWSSSSLCEKSSFLSKVKCLTTLLITSILKTSAALYYLACFNTPSSGMKRCSGSFSFRTNLLTQISTVLCSSQCSLLQSFILQCELVQS